MESGALFDQLRFRSIDVDDIPVVGRVPDYWLAEEWIDSGVPGVLIPPDYKIFSSRGRISHIWQIDRCVQPARLAVFDGALLPLSAGHDYELPSSRLQRGWHRIPLHARAMIDMARRLSMAMDTAFVRVDCFDGPAGPLLGGFTFASGPDHAGGFVHSPGLTAIVDAAVRGEPTPAASGFDIDLDAFWSGGGAKSDVIGNADELRAIQTGALSEDRRYPEALRRRLRRTPGSEVLELSLRVISVLNGEHRAAFGLQDYLATPTGVITGSARRAEFQTIALDHHAARSHNLWHTERGAAMTTALDVVQNV